MKLGAKSVMFFAVGFLGATVLFMIAELGVRKTHAEDPPEFHLDLTPVSSEIKLATSFAPVVKKVAPGVVNIYTTKTVRNPMPQFPFGDDPFFRRFFGEPGPGSGSDSAPRERKEQSLGSGVLVSEDGYILSNNHVVEGADEIKIALADGRKEYLAEVIGRDPQTDIAVLKVDAKDLPALTMTDSDHLEVGDVVLAIGNPFGVGQTVTMGIVSAVSRGGFGIVDYEDFIQTDASINPGNSGGALVDAEGRLVGISTAIISRSGGNQGVGFAVPINMARQVVERIIESGEVVRGYLGIYIQPLTSELASAFNLPDQAGALVARVTPGSAAEKAGFKDGDVVVQFNGQPVKDSRHLRLMVSQTPPDTEVKARVIRDGKPLELTAVLDRLPTEMAGSGPVITPGTTDGTALDGVRLGDLTAEYRQQFRVPRDISGALVLEVDPGSSAYAAGLRPGEVILGINRRPVENSAAALSLLREAGQQRVLIRVSGPGGTRYLVVKP